MPRIITRQEGGIVPLTHTTARVQRPSMWLLVHHVGECSGTPRSGWSDAQHMAALQSYAKNVGKTWEYNYVITAPNYYIWEMGGEFQAAHCLNANSWSYGVQFNITNCNQPTQGWMDSFRWLRQELVNRGQLHPNHQVAPHYRMRSTGCCAPELAENPRGGWNSPTGQGALGNVRPELLVPWTEFPPPPVPEPKKPHEDDDGGGW